MARADPCTRAEGHPEYGVGMGKGMWGEFFPHIGKGEYAKVGDA